MEQMLRVIVCSDFLVICASISKLASGIGSQMMRILRLFKFLRALAKDKTIANVFETVRVSMGQVVNILIILVVIIGNAV